ncbi:hypothetical protein PV371_06675 [Streptomyces sp. TX20-6-3]|uniref:hypothetical protein n=1 Tax=Streptomyces sp. TX20-6-3 TaxID=3028705 RepID=UPI0029B0C11B|nr:hypothetical protein [Streptomyces sp. TX20-6-3]MDX2559331.1 hypothetical protein [Streptomyces sp. TX20-6-3]
MEQVPCLDWRDNVHFDHTRDRPCGLCGRPTPMRSHAGEPVHKVCAEDWNAAHPNEPRRYTRPAADRPQHDVGTWGFHNDGPNTDQRVAALTPVPTDSPPAIVGIDVEPGQRGLFAA